MALEPEEDFSLLFEEESQEDFSLLFEPEEDFSLLFEEEEEEKEDKRDVKDADSFFNLPGKGDDEDEEDN